MPQLNPLPSAVVFDFDGTIADTRTHIVRSYQETFRRLGMAVPDAERITATIGVPLRRSFQSVSDTLELELDLEHSIATHREVSQELGFDDIKPFPGIPGVIQALATRHIPLAIASSRSHDSLDEMVANVGLTGYFQIIAGPEDAEREKPYPDLLLALADRLGLSPASLLMVGDTTFDIEMGHAAGALTCAVTWGNHTRTTLEATYPTLIVENAAELAASLNV